MMHSDNDQNPSRGGSSGDSGDGAGPTSEPKESTGSGQPKSQAAAKEDKLHEMDNVQRGGSRRWTDSLKQVYDPVLDEPIPDAIRDLLSKLDTDGTK